MAIKYQCIMTFPHPATEFSRGSRLDSSHTDRCHALQTSFEHFKTPQRETYKQGYCSNATYLGFPKAGCFQVL